MSFVQNIAVCVIVFIRIGRENGELNWDCGSDEMSRSVTFNLTYEAYVSLYEESVSKR